MDDFDLTFTVSRPLGCHSRHTAMEAWCAPGMRVEVLMGEDGLVGSRYMARVLEMDKGRALVEFEVRSTPPFAHKPSGPLDRQTD